METQSSQAAGSRADVERVIEQAKHELQRMIDLSPDVLVMVDAGGTVQRTNRTLLQLLALPDYSRAVGRNMGDLFAFEDRGVLTRILREPPTSAAEETAAALPDGTRHTLRLSVIGSGGGRWVLMVRDVTGQKEEAARREKMHKKEAVQALAGALMHHANQSLTVIMVTANLLQIELEKGDVASDRLKASLDSIVKHAGRVSELLRQAESPKDYVTETYMEGLDILDLERSGG
jgi:transcriptional regulator with PAS, ATPase and Fis domain